jgi:hypothetical protein
VGAREPIDALDPAMDVELLFHPAKTTDSVPDADQVGDEEPAEVGDPAADVEPDDELVPPTHAGES